jgi:hypothetical protein
MTKDELREIMDLIRVHCPDQVMPTGTAETWYPMLAPQCTYDEAAEAVYAFAHSDKFRAMKFRQIQPVDILEMRRLLRAERAKGYVPPPPPDPDDVQGYISYLRDAERRAGDGGGQRVPVAAVGSGERRMVDYKSERVRADVAPETRAMLDQVRASLGRAP